MKKLLSFLTIFMVISCALFPMSAWAASSASVTSIDTKFENKNLVGEDFSGQNFQEVQFTNVDLSSVNFSQSNLTGAVFNGALLEGANLHGADLSYAISYVSSFKKADLSDAILVGAILKRTSFVDVNITGADFSDAALDSAEISRLCKIATGVNSRTKISTKESLECR